MTHEIVKSIEDQIAQLNDRRADLDRQILQLGKARDALLRLDDPNAPLAPIIEHKNKRKSSPRPPRYVPEFRPLPPPGPDNSAHERTMHKVMAALMNGAETSSEVVASITLPRGGLPVRIQVANALRDLKARGLVEEAGGTGEAIAGRGRAPKRLRVVPAAPAANAGRSRSNGVRSSAR